MPMEDGDKRDDDANDDEFGAATDHWLSRERESLLGLRPPTIHVGVIMKNIARNGLRSFNLREQFINMLLSILEHARKVEVVYVQ